MIYNQEFTQKYQLEYSTSGQNGKLLPYVCLLMTNTDFGGTLFVNNLQRRNTGDVWSLITISFIVFLPCTL